jgi:AcrR family transcriptional regulator
MSSTEPVVVNRVGSVAYNAPQTRIINAAVELFAVHGVGGTSLGMIADALGVSKAAVYHQFRTRDEIVLATAEVDMARLEAVLDAAEAEEGRPQALEVLLTRLVDLAIEHRRMVSIIQSDPVMVRLLEKHKPFRQQMDRLHHLLLGDDPSADERVLAAMVSAAIGSAVSPLVVDIDDDTLRSNLLALARRFIHLPAR